MEESDCHCSAGDSGDDAICRYWRRSSAAPVEVVAAAALRLARDHVLAGAGPSVVVPDALRRLCICRVRSRDLLTWSRWRPSSCSVRSPRPSDCRGQRRRKHSESHGPRTIISVQYRVRSNLLRRCCSTTRSSFHDSQASKSEPGHALGILEARICLDVGSAKPKNVTFEQAAITNTPDTHHPGEGGSQIQIMLIVTVTHLPVGIVVTSLMT